MTAAAAASAHQPAAIAAPPGRWPARATWLAVATAFLICLPTIVVRQELPNDTANYYAPMARELATGNWAGGFFPMIPPLVPLLGGLLARALGLEAYTALKVVSALFFALTVLPLKGLARALWGDRAARWAVWLYVCCGQLVRLGGGGLLDTAKMCFFVWLVYALVRFLAGERRWAATLGVAVAGAGLTLSRGEGIIFAALGGLTLTALDLGRGWRARSAGWRRLPGYTVACAALMFALLLPQLVYEQRLLGYPVTDSRQLQLGPVRALFDAVGYRPSAPPAVAFEAFPWVMGRQTWSNLASETWKGLNPLYLVIAVPVMVWRARRRTFDRREALVLGAVVLHTLVFAALVPSGWLVAKRYISVAVPLLAGWTALGLMAAADWGRGRWPRWGTRVVVAVLVVGVGIGVWSGNSRARPRISGSARLRLEIKADLARWLATAGAARVPVSFAGLRSTTASYHNGRQPVLLTTEPNIIYRAGADYLVLPRIDRGQEGYVYPPDVPDTLSLDWLLERARTQSLHYVVLDPKMAETIPELTKLDALPPGFAVAYDRWREHGWLVLAYEPNLRSAP